MEVNNDCEDFKSKLPFGPPPILPDISEQLEDYFKCPEKLPIHNNKYEFKFWPRTVNRRSLLYAEIGPVGTTLKVNRNPTTGELVDFREVAVDNLGCTARNSSSFTRPPAKVTEDVRGAPSNCPFWPGGLDPPKPSELLPNDTDVDFEKNLLNKAPGLSAGITFSETDGIISSRENLDVENLTEDVPSEGIWSTNKSDKITLETTAEHTTNGNIDDIKKEAKDVDVSTLLEDFKITALRLKIKDTGNQTSLITFKTEWAEVLDSEKPIPDFNKRLVNPAKEYPFELDIFQKQAILKLEQHDHVFVAAHTSAGKTVVAEYAIALSFKHHSKAIYTSPIKALSNQKYRDFQKQFGNVGLITGDYQINETANCLIMTTEILRSMLFKGSSVIRELEYVIFDEVHYINDTERGHVWEQALIMLPDSVTIVMLSATVPNTLEFADWVARTKKRKVYVVSTSKRPVPLQHHLFTGVEGKGPNVFLIRNGDGDFIWDGYKKAAEHFEIKKVEIDKSKVKGGAQKQTGSGFGGGGGKNQQQQQQQKQHKKVLVEKNLFKPPASDKHYVLSLLNYLTKFDKLPVVAFTLSRKKCDNLAYLLRSQDLTPGAKEKNHIHRFFHQNIKHLKDEDQILPQVIWMKELLQNGIGVHHSGILPILREIVEILFQEGYIKFLFATETFAMGVNMPARTVVFDSIDKFDGMSTRVLHPAEYIQMAGRAGRRGLDSTGTVIIMCKGAVPQSDALKKMMIGIPTKLESKFRVTYSMILNTLKVEHMCIEDIMSHSFKENSSRKMMNTYMTQLNGLRKVLNTPENLDKDVYDKLENFYNLATDFIKTWNYSATRICDHPNVRKVLSPGRIVLIIHKEHRKKLAVILHYNVADSAYSLMRRYRLSRYLNNLNEDTLITDEISLKRVLVLRDPTKDAPSSVSDVRKRLVSGEFENLWFKFLALTVKEIFVPTTGTDYHVSLMINAADILEITSFTVKADISLITSDLDQRQIPRFRNDKPNKTCMMALSLLYEKSLALNEEKNWFANIVALSELKISQMEIFTDIEDVLYKKKLVYTALDTILNISDFPEQLDKFLEIKQNDIKKKELEHLLSYESLQSYTDYINKINVLLELGYIDEERKTTTKGNAACNMSTHELILTELIFHNKLSSFDSSEIVALLSCLVFNAKTSYEQKLGSRLEKGVKMIEDVLHKIRSVESRYRVYEDMQPNFKLVGVVYKWASGKLFSDIMKIIPDVQEGIIVRCILQLHEILHCIKFVVGTYAADTVLKEKIEDASDRIKRDIVFTESLYTKQAED